MTDKPMNHRPGYKYRICRKCGLDWNVSITQNEWKYICPWCENKQKRAKEAKSNNIRRTRQ